MTAEGGDRADAGDGGRLGGSFEGQPVDPRQWLLVGSAIALGLAVGLVTRDLPMNIGLGVVGLRPSRNCDERSIIRCAVENVPGVFGDLLVAGAVMVVAAAVLAVIALLAAAVAWRRLRRGQVDWKALGLFGLGAACLVPPAALAVSVIASAVA